MSVEKHKTLSRVCEMNNYLLQNIKTIFRLRKIGLSNKDNKLQYAYVVSLTKDHKHSLEELIWFFYTSCNEMLKSEETLTTDNKSFIISSSEFDVYYYVEAWRKYADKIAYIKDGKVLTELLHRMSCEKAAYIFKKHSIEPFELINTLEVLKKHDNHADRYAALAKSPLLHIVAQTTIKSGK